MSVLSNRSGTATERIERSVPLFFPGDWRNENPNYLEIIPKSTETVSNQTINKQNEAISNWQGTCDRLKNITRPTLVMVETGDTPTLPANSY